jgi:phospholipase/carboxylesterase
MSAPRPGPTLRRACAVALAVASAVPGLRAQDEAAPGRDAVSIQARPGYLEAVQKIAGGDEHGGARTLEGIAAKFGNDPDLFVLHYNLACAHARLKELDPAFAALARAVELGYAIEPGQAANLERDPDLAALRADARFAPLLAGVKRRNAEVAAELPKRLAPFTWVPPPPDGGKPAPVPLLIVLHPYGGERESFARAGFLDYCKQSGFALLAPSGDWMIAPGRFSWFRGGGDFTVHFRAQSRRVWLAVEELKKGVAIDPQRIYVAGFGEGASLGFTLAVRNPQWVRGAVLFGGGYAPSALDDWAALAKKHGRRIALVHGKDDALFPAAGLPAFVDGLKTKGLDLELALVDGGHDLPAAPALLPLLADRLRWIDAAPFEAKAPGH